VGDNAEQSGALPPTNVNVHPVHQNADIMIVFLEEENILTQNQIRHNHIEV